MIRWIAQTYDPAAFRPSRRADTLARYRRDPVGYARDILRVKPWAVQEEIARKLLEPPYRVLVKSSHGVGKTWTGAWLTSWFYDCFDPSEAITTAPTDRDVKDLLWREIRLQRRGRGFTGRAAPELRSRSDHYAKGFTAAKGESFVGRHPKHLLLVFDEAVGIEPIFWETASSMFQPSGDHAWVCFFNPTDTSSEAYRQEQLPPNKDGTPAWHVVTMSSVDHPNVLAELSGETAPYPGAVSLAQFEGWLRQWSDPIGDDEEPLLTDLEWPPESGQWYRPGPSMEARALGRWPSAGMFGVWSEALLAALTSKREIKPNWKTEIGVDVARFGDDDTAIFVRRGLCLVHAESHNGASLDRTAGRLKQLCLKYKGPQNHRQVRVKIDVDGLGAGLLDMADDFAWVGVSAASVSRLPDRYPNLRSELWCGAADLAREGLLDATRLPPDLARELGRQLLAPTYTIDTAGRVKVEPKDQTKKRLKCSPDLADAFNLCCYVPPAARDGLR